MKAVLSITFLTTLLGACNGVKLERDAPELNRTYIVTEDLVLMAIPVPVPYRLASLKERPYVMTLEQYSKVYGEAVRLTPENRVPRGSRALVKQMYTHHGFDAPARYSRMEFSIIDSTERLTAYAMWNEIVKKLEPIGENGVDGEN